jgi:CHAT domain-containing protein/pimeloyl-ACP methyl ester carboxylesterase
MATNRRRSATKRARSRRGDGASVSPAAVRTNTAFELSDQEVERALQTGAYSGLLEDYFGPEQYAELRQLKRDAAARSIRGGPKVLLLPGIMGSKIGRDRKLNPFDDVVWVDPLGIARGHLSQIALPDKGRWKAIGVMLIAYLKLKFRLQREGYDADFYPFDWRKSIADLGAELKAKLAQNNDEISLVAHSMGGLVARAAIQQGAPFKKLVMLGTPNHGSFAPVLALRGTYPVVRKIGWLDRKHTPEELSRDVFSSFPGLTQMLPFQGHFDGVDLYDVKSWPEAAKGYAPRKEILRETPKVQQALAAGDERMFMIAGVDQKTVVGIRLPEDGKPEFQYELSPEGDGTVPLQLARLPGVRATYYISESHGSLANNGLVGNAVIDLLERDSTDVLVDAYERPSERRAVEVIPESQLRVEPYEGTRGSALSQRELRELVEEVASPNTHEALEPRPGGQPARITGVVPAPGFDHMFDRVRVGRNNYHRIDLRFAYGSITEADTRAIVLGLFRDVAPGGAAAAVDARMAGAVTELYRRRMFSANVGEVFMLPTGRHQLVTDFVTFVGLGPFDQFTDDVLQTASENTIRTLISARIEEFATVLYGGGSGETPANALSNMLTGFLRGLTDADKDHHFRRIVICERDRDRYLAIKEELYRLSSTALCDNVELTFDETVLREEPISVATPATRAVRREQAVYLIVRQERAARGELDIRSSVLTAGAKAAVITGVHTVNAKKLEHVRKRIVEQTSTDFAKNGKELASLILNEQVLSVMPSFRKHPLVVVHDAPTSRIPWETLAFGSGREIWHPAAEQGMSHRYAAESLSVAKWLEERVQDNVLSVLLVVNPTEDLDGAEAEGELVRELLGGTPGVRMKELRHGEATRQALLTAFGSGEYDIIHYAGHAEFDEARPARSGVVCASDVRLTGADLASISRLPTLVFFNACESARVRGRRNGRKPAKGKSKQRPGKSRTDEMVNNVGLAEAFMRGGVANFLGTYWPVGDAAAESFARTFYTDILAGRTLGEAIVHGRSVVRAKRSPDWADYIFYGNADFVLKDV